MSDVQNTVCSLKDYLESNKQLKKPHLLRLFQPEKEKSAKRNKQAEGKYQKNKSIVVLEVDPEFIFKKAELYY